MLQIRRTSAAAPASTQKGASRQDGAVADGGAVVMGTRPGDAGCTSPTESCRSRWRSCWQSGPTRRHSRRRQFGCSALLAPAGAGVKALHAALVFAAAAACDAVKLGQLGFVALRNAAAARDSLSLTSWRCGPAGARRDAFRTAAGRAGCCTGRRGSWMRTALVWSKAAWLLSSRLGQVPVALRGKDLIDLLAHVPRELTKAGAQLGEVVGQQHQRLLAAAVGVFDVDQMSL